MPAGERKDGAAEGEKGEARAKTVARDKLGLELWRRSAKGSGRKRKGKREGEAAVGGLTFTLIIVYNNFHHPKGFSVITFSLWDQSLLSCFTIKDSEKCFHFNYVMANLIVSN